MPIDDRVDALLDLDHDLGKYLRLPLVTLPPEATDGEIREAVRTALLQTRRGPGGVRAAHDLWRAFCQEVGEDLATCAEWNGLCEAVNHALAWEAALERGGQRIARAEVERDFAAVTAAIRRLIADLQQDFA